MCTDHHLPETSILINELTISSKTVKKLDNFIVMGDFNIDITKENCSGFDKLDELCDTFNSTNLVKSEACHNNTHQWTIDLYFLRTNHDLFKEPPQLKLDLAIVTS